MASTKDGIPGRIDIDAGVSGRGQAVLILDPHPVMREGIASVIDRIGNLEVITSTSSWQEAERAIKNAKVDLLVLSLELGLEDGLECLRVARSISPGTAVIGLSVRDPAKMAEQVLHYGGVGFVSKHSPTQYLETAVREVLAGRVFMPSELSVRPSLPQVEVPSTHPEESNMGLSTRELEIFGLLGSGRTARQIAESLGLSVKTVASHRANIQAKLGVKSLAELLRWAVLWFEQEGSLRRGNGQPLRRRTFLVRPFDGEI